MPLPFVYHLTPGQEFLYAPQKSINPGAMFANIVMDHFPAYQLTIQNPWDDDFFCALYNAQENVTAGWVQVPGRSEISRLFRPYIKIGGNYGLYACTSDGEYECSGDSGQRVRVGLPPGDLGLTKGMQFSIRNASGKGSLEDHFAYWSTMRQASGGIGRIEDSAWVIPLPQRHLNKEASWELPRPVKRRIPRHPR